MTLKKDRSTAEAQSYWDYVERVAREVREWPAWKRGEADG